MSDLTIEAAKVYKVHSIHNHTEPISDVEVRLVKQDVFDTVFIYAGNLTEAKKLQAGLLHIEHFHPEMLDQWLAADNAQRLGYLNARGGKAENYVLTVSDGKWDYTHDHGGGGGYPVVGLQVVEGDSAKTWTEDGTMESRYLK